MLVTRGRVSIPNTLNIYLRQIEQRFVVLSITGEIAEKAMTFSEHYPMGPADRIIGATALVHGVALVTSDRHIRSSGEVPCIW